MKIILSKCEICGKKAKIWHEPTEYSLCKNCAEKLANYNLVQLKDKILSFHELNDKDQKKTILQELKKINKRISKLEEKIDRHRKNKIRHRTVN